MTDVATIHPNPYLAFIRAKAGTDKWCVAHRMTPPLQAKGYTRAIHPRTYQKWTEEYERDENRISNAALDLYRALRMIRDVETIAHVMEPHERLIVDAALAKAEGTN